MAIYIKGVELPTDCLSCPFTEKDDRMGTVCYFTNIVALNIGRQKDCPLTEVPEPHGRLADADALYKELVKESDFLINELENQEKNPNEYTDNFRIYTSYVLSGLSSAMISLFDAPTVIERSE